jgi:hypothetical protein
VATFSPGRFACASLEGIVSKDEHHPAKRKPARKNSCPMSRLPDSTKEQLGLGYPAIADHNPDTGVSGRETNRRTSGGRWPMPIRPFLNGEQFDQETVRILGVAFEQVCIALRIGDCGDEVKNAIANRIIELAKTGERNPDQLCERALEDIREPHV